MKSFVNSTTLLCSVMILSLLHRMKFSRRVIDKLHELPKRLLRYCSWYNVLKWVCGIVFVYGAICMLHQWTYIFQVTTFARMVRPVARTSCLPEVLGGPLSSTIAASNTIPAALSNPKLIDPQRIGILMVYDKGYGGSDRNLVPSIIKNREQYCLKHGYTLIKSLDGEGSTIKASSTTTTLADGKKSQVAAKEVVQRPPAWGKLTAIKDALETGKYDYVVYIDMDMVIMNANVKIENFIRTSVNSPITSPSGSRAADTTRSGAADAAAGVTSSSDSNSNNDINGNVTDFILTSDWSGVNTGIMIVKNSEFSKWFLQTAWDQEQLVAPYSPLGQAYPFEYEQRAFHFLLNTRVWQQRHLPTYRGDSTDLWKHFHELPQCAMNSYILHPFEMRGNREESQYVEGDFIVHMAGKKGQIKTNLMNYYLQKAAQKFESGREEHKSVKRRT